MRVILTREEVSLIVEVLEDSLITGESLELAEKLAKLLAKDSKEWKESTRRINDLLKDRSE